MRFGRGGLAVRVAVGWVESFETYQSVLRAGRIRRVGRNSLRQLN